MNKLAKAGIAALGGLGAYALLLRPRQNHPGWEALSGVRYAHRGLHDMDLGVPENSMAAFRRAVEHGFGAELDVHLMADGSLAVVHDSSLERVCGRRVCIEDLTAAELADCTLMGTEETVPLLRDVLALFEGKTPLIIELKVERGNAVALTDAVMAALAGWNGVCCIESFHPGVLLRLRQKHPEVIRGQLSQNFLADTHTGMGPAADFIMTHLLTTFLTKPDFIAYHHGHRDNISLRLMKKAYGVHEAAWTVKDRAAMEALDRDGAVSIFEGFIP